MSVEDFADYDGVLQLGVAPYRIDIISRATGISFDQAIEGAGHFEIEGRTVPVIGRAALLENERATARAQDLADVEALEKQT